MNRRHHFVAAVAGSVLLLGLASSAHGAEALISQDEIQGISSGATDVATSLGMPDGAVGDPDVAISADADVASSLDLEQGSLEMTVPSASDGGPTADGVVFDAPGSNSSITVQSTELGGLRALISISSKDAPTEYQFPISGDVAALRLDASGGAVALDEEGNPIAYAATPWAMDADGTSVPTHFEVRDTTLVQVIDHRSGDYSYGVVADPWWNPFSWNWNKIGAAIAKGAKRAAKVTVCAAAITVAVLPVAKGAKLVKELGGVKETARLLVGAGNMTEVRSLLGGAAAEILGISTIKSKCF